MTHPDVQHLRGSSKEREQQSKRKKKIRNISLTSGPGSCPGLDLALRYTRRRTARPARASHLRKAEVAFTASVATSSTGLLTASRRARPASRHMAELVNSLISSGCLRNSKWRTGERTLTHPARNQCRTSFLLRSGPSSPVPHCLLTESGSQRRAARPACAAPCCSSSGCPAGSSPPTRSLPQNDTAGQGSVLGGSFRACRGR